MSSPATKYDEVRYPGNFYPQASPERLATLVTMYGLQPAPVIQCRVLELGCGEGGNVVPLAFVFPHSTFVGVDLSSSAIDHGADRISRLGLTNAELRVQDLMEFPADAGLFDYIVVHGILSWVPEGARQQILEICSRHLAPKGVAYISYNTLPGGYLRSYARDLMRFHTRFISDPSAKTLEARNVIDFVASAIPTPTLERELLKRELKPYEGKDSFLFHDLLAEVNEAIYFLDFMDAASRVGLQFVSEANLQSMRTAHFPEHVRRELDGMSDRLLREQYLDFINGRRFRQTVLCRAGHDLDLEITPERMERLLVGSYAKPEQPIADLRTNEPVQFRVGQSAPISCSEPIAKAVYLVLAEMYPRCLRFSQLRQEVCARLNMAVDALTAEDDARMIRMLISSFANGLAELHVHQFEYRNRVSDRPAVSALARLQAETGDSVVSMSLQTYSLPDGLMRCLVPLLDGTRDFQGLMLDLAARLGGSESVSSENLRKALDTLCWYGLLVS
jgi:methyltransferase-like protein/ubiquinone/menaquinone biosynthesis C-methylase UbiE